MITGTEMQIQSQMTRQFILTDPETIFMNRKQQVRDPDTGALTWTDPVPQTDPVVVRLLPNTFSDSPIPEANTAEGEVPWPLFTLLAEPGSDIERNDTFSWRGEDWRIDEIHQKPDYEFRADVMRDAS